MQKISNDNKEIFLVICKYLSMCLLIAIIIFCLVLSAIFIGVVFEVRPEYKQLFDDRIFASKNSITAFAAEEPPSDNGLSVYPNSNSILAPGFDYQSAILYDNDGSEVQYFNVNALVTHGSDYLHSNPNYLLQFVFYVDDSLDNEMFYYLDNISLPFSFIGVATDNGWADRAFAYSFYWFDDPDTGDSSIEVCFHQFLYDYNSTFEVVRLYDIRLIEPPPTEDEPISETFFGAISDGLTFGFDSIPTGISYIFDELFVVDGKLTTYSYAVFSLCGVSIVLGLIKFILSFIFSLGGK